MGAVQAAKFHQLERLDICHHLRAGSLPVRTPAGKFILDHPLAKRLVNHHRRIHKAG